MEKEDESGRGRTGGEELKGFFEWRSKAAGRLFAKWGTTKTRGEFAGRKFFKSVICQLRTDWM